MTSGADRGPGSLRDALFAADSAASSADIVIRVASVTLQSALPPLVNPHGMRLIPPPGGIAIDGTAVHGASPLFDVDADRASLEGLSIHGCPGIAILVRAARFRLANSRIEACDVAVEVAANARSLDLERNAFRADRIGVRFSAPSADTVVLDNQFDGNTTAGLWLVASQPQPGAPALSVRNNRFNADATDVVVGNVPAVIDHNDFSAVHDAAIHIIGAGAVVRNNHITDGAAAGIVAENARDAVIDSNELDHLQGYAILLRSSTDSLVRANRIQTCSYGMGFVLGDPHHPNSAVDNELIDLNYDGIDVIGESPVLRRNQVLQARVAPLHVTDFIRPDGAVVPARPLLEKNRFEIASAAGRSVAAR